MISFIINQGIQETGPNTSKSCSLGFLGYCSKNTIKDPSKWYIIISYVLLLNNNWNFSSTLIYVRIYTICEVNSNFDLLSYEYHILTQI